MPLSLLSRQWLCLFHACTHIESNKIAKITPQNALSSEDYWARSSYILRQRSTPKIYSTGSPKRRDFSINLNDARLSRLAQLKREPKKKTSEFNGTLSDQWATVNRHSRGFLGSSEAYIFVRHLTPVPGSSQLTFNVPQLINYQTAFVRPEVRNVLFFRWPLSLRP